MAPWPGRRQDSSRNGNRRKIITGRQPLHMNTQFWRETIFRGEKVDFVYIKMGDSLKLSKLTFKKDFGNLIGHDNESQLHRCVFFSLDARERGCLDLFVYLFGLV